MVENRTFSYKAKDNSGAMSTGTIAATSAEEVATKLRADGKYVLSVNEHALTETAVLNREEICRSESAKKVKRDEVIGFSQQLGVMMETGVPLTEALDSFLAQNKNLDFKKVLTSISNDIHDGERFSSALAKWPRVFPGIMISLMKASEASGTMSSMLCRVGLYLAKERRTLKQIKGALSYPIFMMLVGLAITIFLVSVVLPRFAMIYEQRSASLPLPTQILLDISDFATSKILVYGPVLVVLAIAFFIWKSKPSGRKTLDWIRLNCPIISSLYSQLYLTRASRTMATLLAAGVSLLDIIDICRGVTNNYYWDLMWDEMDEQIRNGQQLSTAIALSGVIPPNVISMIAAGEKSGKLSEVMEKIAEFSDEELDVEVKQTTTFIEPIMICIMGIVIGGVAIALLLPIFTVGTVMGAG